MLMFSGRTLVFYRLSPYYGALGLVLVALSGCLLCRLLGFSFIALILILIYVGGMLVVFVYSTAISAERYPMVRKFNEVLVLRTLVILWGVLRFDPLVGLSSESWVFVRKIDLVGARELYKVMG